MKLKQLFMLVLLFVAGQVLAQKMPVIPIDTAVRIGKLPNGLTYYIRYNNWPEHRADFYIAQKVGSIQEDENQRGLAHFLEHMCFNGTKHFKSDALVKYCESIGVQYGGDLNAYTSTDQTVYNISNVPTTRQSALDSCLLILSDWADGLTLDPQEIDKERGVIHEEWRLRTKAYMRMLERDLPKLYPGSKYGLRMPIGLMSVVDNFKPKALRDYYEKWYRPDNQGIIIVGDVDVNHVEAEIKKLFGGIKSQPGAAKVVDEQVPDNNTPIFVIDKDKEQERNSIELMFKHAAVPDSMKTTLDYMLEEYVKQTALSMVNDRFREYVNKPESPFVSAYAWDDSYIISKTKDAFTLQAQPKDGKIEESLKVMLREATRAAKFGFTPTEYSRAKADMLSGLDKMYSNRDKRENSQFYEEYKNHFLDNEPIPSIDYYYATLKQMVPVIPIEAINEAMRVMVSVSDTNMVVVNFNNEKEGNVYPTEVTLKKAIDEARAEELTPYVDNVKNEPLIKDMPKKGKIKKETVNKKFDYKELILSNGVKVILKKTDFKKDEVRLSAEGQGGSSLYGEKDYVNLEAFKDVINASGLGNFKHNELPKALAGKIASASMWMTTMYEQISGSSTPKDVETMFQLVYLYFTHINKDQESYDNLMNSYQIVLKNRALSPDNAFSDSLTYTRYMHNPRFRSLEVKDIKSINYDRILEIAKERTANAAAYTFTIIGNFEEDSIRPLLEQYIASLPVQKKIEKGHRVNNTADGIVVNQFCRKMETPKASAVMVWKNDKMPYTLENAVKVDVAGQILDMIYNKKIREDASAAYYAGAAGDISHAEDGYTTTILYASCPMKPEKCDTALTIMRTEVPGLTEKCDPAMLAKVKEYMLKNADDSFKTNDYWSGIIDIYRKYGLDFYTTYKDVIKAQTPESISAFVKELLKANNRVEVVMMPQK